VPQLSWRIVLRLEAVVLWSLEAEASVADEGHKVLGPKSLFNVNEDKDKNHQA
jgi:hypothetical protein